MTTGLNSRLLRLWALAAVTVAAVTLVACGGGGGGDAPAGDAPIPAPIPGPVPAPVPAPAPSPTPGPNPPVTPGDPGQTATFTVGGSLSGLGVNKSVAVQDATGASIVLNANGNFTLLSGVPSGATYSLSIKTQPQGQFCGLSNGSGTVANASVNNVAVVCGALMTLLAGNFDGAGFVDGLGQAAAVNQPTGVATDTAGNVYVADTINHTIRMVTPAGVVSTLAGLAGVSGVADGAGSAARFNFPEGIATDSAGNVYVADTGNRTIRKITSAGLVSTLAGTAGTPGSADGVGVGAALFDQPVGIATDLAGNVYVSDLVNHNIRKITPAGASSPALVSTLAGSAGNLGSVDGIGLAASFNGPFGIATDSAANVFVVDKSNHTIRKITPAGAVSTVAGLAGASGSTNGIGTVARFFLPSGITVGVDGSVYVVEASVVRKITPDGEVSLLAGATTSGSIDGLASVARFSRPLGIAIDSAGNLFVADTFNHTIRKLTPTGQVSTLVGRAASTGSANGTGTSALFSGPKGISSDSVGNIYVADTANSQIRKISPAGAVVTLAGVLFGGGSTDGAGSIAQFRNPSAVTIDPAGNVFVADTFNNRIRMVTPAGEVSTLAGNSAQGSTDGTGSAASFKRPQGIAADGTGNVYVADTNSSTIRKITSLGEVSTFAGTADAVGSADGLATAARFSRPTGLALDSAGNLYVSDGSHTIRKITPQGEVSTFAGLALSFGATDGAGAAARFSSPAGIAVDSADNVYVADSGNHSVRKITPAGNVSTLVGTAGKIGVTFSQASTLRNPQGVAVFGGKLFITTANGVVSVDLP
jgi:sugar lactone lactonase YvrE